MNRDRVRKISALTLLVLAGGAFAYFGLIRRQPRHNAAGSAGQEARGTAVYYCPMHKNYHSDKPGNCPICSMKLVKLEGPDSAAAEPESKAPAAPQAVPSSQ